MLYPRQITLKIKKWLFEKEIIILNGPRQTGKTSLLEILKNELIKSGAPEKTIFYLNLEEIKILETLNQDPENILKYITSPEEKNYFFLDEIQYLDNPSNFLKHLYDKYAGKIKIIATGSSSLEIKAKFQDSLAGRKVSFLINPLTFKEFLNFHSRWRESRLLDYLEKKDLPPDIKSEFEKALDEYLVYGGMPAVVLQDKEELKQKMLNEYVSDYINKDIRAIGRIESVAGFNGLVKILAAQIGGLLNISELGNAAGISRRETKRYLDLLEFTFVLDKILPFKKNIKKQVVKMPKIYFFDLGIRNAVIGNFLDLDSRQDSGSIFENFVFLELKNQKKDKIFFYRAASRTEIDFVVEDEAQVLLLESKYKKLSHPIDSRVLENFMEKESNAKKATIINMDLNCKDGLIEYADYRFITV